MGLTDWLARAAAQTPHLLLIEAPGAWRIRVAVEQAMARRGWRMALSPADADIIVVCGHVPSDESAEVIERLWSQMPGPRARLSVTQADARAITTVLEAALSSLLDGVGQREDATSRDPRPSEIDAAHSGQDDEPTHEAETHDQDAAHNEHAMDEDHTGTHSSGQEDTHHAKSHDAADESTAMDHGGMDHAGMDHAGMTMEGPGGIALASGGPDRDGLSMDVLNVRLGPVLALWPAGLIVRLSLQGDVVTDAKVDQTPPPVEVTAAASGREAGAWRCDSAKDLLTLAGADRTAALARRARDLLLDSSAPDKRALAVVEHLQRQVHSSRVLRWSLRGLAPVERDGVLHGDVHERLLRLLQLTLHETRTGCPATTERDTRAVGLDLASALPGLLMGTELSTARLAVASVIGFHHFEPRPAEATHG